MNEMLSRIQIWKRKPYEYISCIPMNEIWLRLEICVSYAYHMNEMPRKVWLWKRDNLMCTSYEWGFMHSLNGMLRRYVYEKERFLCLALDACLCS